MNLDELVQSAFLKALGWAVLNSFWQFALLWLIFMFAIRAIKSLSSHQKHGLALTFLSVGSGWFVAELCVHFFTYRNSPDGRATGYLLPETALSKSYLAAREFLEANLPYVSFLYLVVVGVLFAQFIVYFYHSRTIRTQGLSKTKAQLRLYVQQRAQLLGIRRTVQVWISEYVNTPIIIGFFKPMILIPLACISQLSTQQLEAVLLHELAHIKRNDYAINLFVATAEILFFFNPFTRLFVRVIKHERETSCDDWVLQFRFDPHQYASALLSLEQSRSASFNTGLAATGGSNNILLHRVQRILQVKTTEKNNGPKLMAYMLTIGVLYCLSFVQPAQQILQKPSARASAGNRSAFIQVRNLAGPGLIAFREHKKPGKPVPKAAGQAQVAGISQPQIAAEAEAEDALALPVFVNADVELKHLANLAVATEERDFSIIEQAPAVAPDAVEPADHPFVPSSSFSFRDAEDTTKPKVRLESYQEREAREALLNAQKAIEKIDWKEVKKQLNSKADLAKIQKTIQQSLEQLNWKEINNEVTKTMNQANTQRLRESLKVDYDKLRVYKAQQQEYEQLHTELRLQQEKTKKDLEKKEWEINKLITRKKVIVHI